MFCTNCGQAIANNAAICIHCGVAVGTEKRFCGNCGQAVNENQAICLKCGVPLQQTSSSSSGFQVNNQKMIRPSGQSATTAMILSCLWVGLGQIYLGQTLKGLAIMASALMLGPISWVVGMVDAYKIGKKLETGQSVGGWEFF